ncbi:MAG: PTS fructose transporter subunit IIA [Polynucleobacter sp.]|jgi:PTS system ascorbate-specific IIA component|nr:PTS fructose transporter subunit IIA [Polynucleobacter sp.]
MVSILIVAHTPVADAMLGFAEHTYGLLPEGVAAIDIPPHEDLKISFERVLQAAQKIISDDGILVLTDVMGATPANVASRLTAPDVLTCNVAVLAGLNLPMLMRAISYRQEGLETVVQKTIQGGQNGILRLGTQAVSMSSN